MRATLNDLRPLATAIVDPATGAAYDRTTGAWGPFDPAKHLTPFIPVPNLPPALKTLQTIPGLDVLLARPDCVAVMVAVDAAGQPTAVVDVWPSPAPFPYPTCGGLGR